MMRLLAVLTISAAFLTVAPPASQAQSGAKANTESRSKNARKSKSSNGKKQPASNQAKAAKVAAASGVPNLQELLALIRSTMAALHHANTTKNYTVLRDMTAPSLRKNITPETLLKAFKGLREQSADLSQTLVLTPEVSEPPAIDEAGQLRLSGRFPTKPLTTQFEIAFKRVENAWLISDLSVTMLK